MEMICTEQCSGAAVYFADSLTTPRSAHKNEERQVAAVQLHCESSPGPTTPRLPVEWWGPDTGQSHLSMRSAQNLAVDVQFVRFSNTVAATLFHTDSPDSIGCGHARL